MLKSLEIGGFKSFAKKTELSFKSKVTAIVGPNGSGKSNVAEAFRFALGEQSIKSMRGRRGEDLIWNGSNEVSRSNRAQVKIVLDNPENILGLDFDEISIERVVSRDGGNEYYLNGSQVRLKDIFEILSKAHIGASGHHIISQGEADRILTASIKERREIIEDALGLKIYQYKREESERKLVKTEENIKQVESLRREIAPHLKFLKRQVEKAEKAEELKTRLVVLEREYLKKELVFIEQTKNEIGEQKKPLESRLNALDKEMESAKEVLENSLEKDGKSQDLLEIEDTIKAERENKDALYREAGKIEGEINANKRNIEKIETEQRSEENKTVLLKEVEDLEKEINAFSEISKIFEKIRSFILSHKSKFDHKYADELKEKNQELAEEKVLVDEKIEEASARLFELSATYQKIKDSIERDKNSNREAEKAIFKIAGEQTEIRSKISLIEAGERQLKTIEDDWKRELTEAGALLGSAILGFEKDELEISDENYRGVRDEKRRELEKTKIRLEELGGNSGGDILKEYKETNERDAFLAKELEDLSKSKKSLETLVKDLLEKLDTEFKEGVGKINKAFQKYFEIMFGGGNAELKIEKLVKKFKNADDADELEQLKNLTLEESQEEAGLEISVSLPKKRIRSLEMLSGGERALTSIALLFAVSSVNPPPFIILDETDAALDEANSKKYGDMIESLSKTSQLILITHNRETMSRAGVIYGVTMGRDGVSRLLSIAFDEAVAVAK